ncbi:MAG: hypothetical protein AAF628_33775 [Planctomycetota bacterium]
MRVISLSVLLFALPTASALAQDSRPSKPAASPVAEALAKLSAAEGSAREAALRRYMLAQMQTTALYSGQYAGLRKAGEGLDDQLIAWAYEPPLDVPNEDLFRQSCVRALRDLLGSEAPEKVTAKLREMAEDDYEEQSVKLNAAAALAQFGDSSLIDKLVKTMRAGTESENPQQRAMAWFRLSDVYYSIQDYSNAADAFAAVLKMHEDGTMRLDRISSPAIVYYNCACCYSRAGKLDEAFGMLEKAMQIGGDPSSGLNRRLLESDQDIAPLREDERFAKLMAEHYPG